MHLRGVIKSTIVDMLSAQTDGVYATVAENRVYKSRYIPLMPEEDEPTYPAICVYTPDEKSEEFDNETAQRVCTVTIECFAKGPDADDVLDVIANQIEYAFLQDETLTSNVEKVVYTGGNLGIDEDGHNDIVAWRMNYDATYNTLTTADDSLLNYLAGANADYQNGTSDIIDIPEEF